MTTASARGRNNRVKGKTAERELCNFLTATGFPSKRRLAGNGQAGDISVAAVPDAVIEVKNTQTCHVDTWLEQLEAEAEGITEDRMALLWRPPGTPNPERWVSFVPHGVVPRHDGHDLMWSRGPTTAQMKDLAGAIRVGLTVRASLGPWSIGDGVQLFWALETWRIMDAPPIPKNLTF